MLNAVDFLAVTLQRAPLRETLLAEEALVRSHSCVRPRMPLEIERVVEPLPAECTQVTFHVTVTLHVTIEEPLKAEVLAAHAAGEAIRIVVLLSKESKSNYAVE